MPFDTTYHYVIDEKNSVTIVKPGGKDTLYELSGSQKFLDSITSADGTKSFLQQTAHSEYQQKPPSWDGFLQVAFVLFAIFIFIKTIGVYLKDNKKEHWAAGEAVLQTGTFMTNEAQDSFTYQGKNLKFTEAEYRSILCKRFPYFNALISEDQTTFIYRLDKFIKSKIFQIHSNEVFKEMPVLISAAAIQLTFGLTKYLLPNFIFIHIFPEEFVRVQPVICFLEGNVSGHTINLSWKHFLNGISLPDDGKNVGLHEMSHALYYQNFVSEENVDVNFKHCFDKFDRDGNKVYNIEMANQTGLYSDYAMTNFQEFWAESVEIFFEKPLDMQKDYANLYAAMSEILNQDPASKATSLPIS